MAGEETFQGERATVVSATTAQLVTGIGRVCRILVIAGAQIDVYDDTASVNKIFSVAATTGQVYQLDCPVRVGLRVVVAAGGSATVIYSGN